jgi:hypothetical protein
VELADRGMDEADLLAGRQELGLWSEGVVVCHAHEQSCALGQPPGRPVEFVGGVQGLGPHRGQVRADQPGGRLHEGGRGFVVFEEFVGIRQLFLVHPVGEFPGGLEVVPKHGGSLRGDSLVSGSEGAEELVDVVDLAGVQEFRDHGIRDRVTQWLKGAVEIFVRDGHGSAVPQRQCVSRIPFTDGDRPTPRGLPWVTDVLDTL